MIIEEEAEKEDVEGRGAGVCKERIVIQRHLKNEKKFRFQIPT